MTKHRLGFWRCFPLTFVQKLTNCFCLIPFVFNCMAFIVVLKLNCSALSRLVLISGLGIVNALYLVAIYSRTTLESVSCFKLGSFRTLISRTSSCGNRYCHFFHAAKSPLASSFPCAADLRIQCSACFRSNAMPAPRAYFIPRRHWASE